MQRNETEVVVDNDYIGEEIPGYFCHICGSHNVSGFRQCNCIKKAFQLSGYSTYNKWLDSLGFCV